LLAPSGRRSDHIGYVEEPALAMRDEPEALSVAEWETHVVTRQVTVTQHQTIVTTAALEHARKLLTLEERQVALRGEAKRRGMDLSREFRLLALMVRSGKHDRHVETRLYAAERRVYRTGPA
jgi:ATP/maltotriose-dependent transcriptional regulator MalT